MDQLPEQQEAEIANDTQLELGWLLEEQLLLAMPLVPLHAKLTECAQGASSVEANDLIERDAPQSAASLDTQRPFADLRELLNQRAKNRSN
jgi:uncharacterized metal-binding protein YceD (DUF177 family)